MQDADEKNGIVPSCRRRACWTLFQNVKVLRLAIHDEPYPYLVALNFGYETVDGKLTFYFTQCQAGQED